VWIDVPPAVRWIVSRLEEAGYETWTVGGAVRDALLDRASGDWDLATRAPPEEVRRIFPRTVPVGMEHGTVGVLARDGTMYEVTTFRRDVETFGRHAVVAFADTLDEDLGRRDFTINAVAWHPVRGVLFDPHGGRDDLGRGLLRTVGDPSERFSEDYLRVFRALRFAGRFSLEVEPGTWKALRAATSGLGVLSPERVREELWKVLGDDARPGRALELYRRSGVLMAWYPELDRVAGTGTEGSRRWGEILAVAGAVSLTRPLLRLTALLGDLGEPDPVPSDPPLPGDGGPTASPVGLRGMVRSAALLTRLRHSRAQIAEISGLVGAGSELPDPDAPGEDLRRWLARVGRERVPQLVRWAAAESRSRVRGALPPERVVSSWRRIREELSAGHPLTVGDLALTGRDLIRMGLKPGPHFGQILDALLDRVLTDPSLNAPDALEALAMEVGGRMDGETDGDG
jgi:tRNA nucleotidyltransferase (CCA-adding enzyme)